MDEYIFNSLEHYFTALSKLGHYCYKDVYKLLVLVFWYRMFFEDYRGYVKREDYRAVEEALNCLYGSSCLIPYADYLKMGKLKLGEMTELAQRVSTLETTAESNTERIETLEDKQS